MPKNVLGKENIGRLSFYTEGNQGKIKGWRIKLDEMIDNC